MRTGDLAAFPSGTGICHAFLNNGTSEAVLLVGGESNKADNRIVYPLHPRRRDDMPWSHWLEAILQKRGIAIVRGAGDRGSDPRSLGRRDRQLVEAA